MKKAFSFSRLARSFGYAGRGMRWVLESEPNVKIHLGATVLALATGIWLQLSAVEWGIIVLCIGTVLAAEAFNTAIELLADVVHPEENDLVGKAKDVSAGAVLFTALAASAAGAMVFLPKLWNLIQNMMAPTG